MTPSLRILADENIPAVRNVFGPFGSVRTLPGHSITASHVHDVDVLLVRSVTSVDADLVADSPVQFIGSATTGTDHVDRDALDKAGIAFAHAPGANATSVADYVVAALLQVAVRTGASLDGRCLGIVGCGHIGQRLAQRAPALGLDVLQNDPPRADAADAAGHAHSFVSLAHVLDAADIVTLHVPLTHDGPHPTHHLIDADALRQMDADTWLLNTSRGAVVDNTALLHAIDAGTRGPTVLDVWEHEPTPMPELLRRVDLATPHIAGYALDGKLRGTRMIFNALCAHLEVDMPWPDAATLSPASLDALSCTPPDPRLPRTEWLHALAQQAYLIGADDARLRPYVTTPADKRGAFFSRLRKTYPRRREMQVHRVPPSAIPDAHHDAVKDGLTIDVTSDGSR